MTCDSRSGHVSELTNVPTNAIKYAGTTECDICSRSFVAAVFCHNAELKFTCVDVATGQASVPLPWSANGTQVCGLDVSGTCVAVATDQVVIVLDPHTNDFLSFPVPTTVCAISCFRLSVGCYIADAKGHVYSVAATGVCFVGCVPAGLQTLYALADESCVANSDTCTSILFANTGRCVDFKRLK